MPSFAERELTKFGWEKGQGLGKSGGGLKKAITVGVKNNTGGLGTDDKAWGFQWWDHIFNKTTAGITIEQDDEGEVQILKASVSVQKQQEKALLYGAFVKSSEYGILHSVGWRRWR
ncbi:hypothetical protein BC831DRAFT_459141 [Entophlyctis helioformis]|nr:hypothetical protein BC831DRAFT_459141 [Entophlyctis helioformis]